MSIPLQPSPALLHRPSFPFFFFPFSRTFAAISPGSLAVRPLRLHRHPSAALPISGQDLLCALTGSFDGAGADSSRTHLPAIRSYERDLVGLTIIGAVSSDQALTAAAADGGDAAQEHLSSGVSTMVVETVFPGAADERSTVSTRLFLPAKEVKEKAKKLKSRLITDVLTSNPAVSKNILAVTFRQVVLRQLWSFKLSFFCPGTERDMEDITTPREAAADFSVSSSVGRFLLALAEAICSFALHETERNHSYNAGGSIWNNLFPWFQKAQVNCSADSSICVYRIPESEIVKNAMSQVEKYKLAKGKYSINEKKLRHRWWVAPNYSRLERAGGSEFSHWINEFIPAYKIKINNNFFKDAKLEGWKELDDNSWEAHLTHLQMLELASILDMYYEDRYTLPDKQLFCGLITESTLVSSNKTFLWKMLFVILAGACVFVLVGMLARASWPYLAKVKKPSQSTYVSTTESESCHIQSPGTAETKSLCILVVQKIKNALGWPGDIEYDANVGAWIGILPSYTSDTDLTVHSISGDEEKAASHSNEDRQSLSTMSVSLASTLEARNVAAQTTAEDIASFQVVISPDCKIIGFQPSNRVAVNQWASNPLAKELYNGRWLSPGLLEPRLKVPLPPGVILLELLMSVSPGSSFVLARPKLIR